jgi:hypothetical protein
VQSTLEELRSVTHREDQMNFQYDFGDFGYSAAAHSLGWLMQINLWTRAVRAALRASNPFLTPSPHRRARTFSRVESGFNARGQLVGEASEMTDRTQGGNDVIKATE